MPDTPTPAELARRLSTLPAGMLSPWDQENIKLAREALSRLSQVERERDASDAARDVIAERRRQVEVEGRTPEHDDEHRTGEMARAAAAYAYQASSAGPDDDFSHLALRTMAKKLWPWGWEWWKPKGPRRDLVRAGALIIAEIERLDRSRQKAERT